MTPSFSDVQRFITTGVSLITGGQLGPRPCSRDITRLIHAVNHFRSWESTLVGDQSTVSVSAHIFSMNDSTTMPQLEESICWGHGNLTNSSLRALMSCLIPKSAFLKAMTPISIEGMVRTGVFLDRIRRLLL